MDLTRENIQNFFNLFAQKNIEEIIKLFNSDSVFIDAHYPGTKLVGKNEIERGFIWSMKNAKEMKFEIKNFVSDNNIAFVEVFAKHKLFIGIELNFTEVFIIEMNGDFVKRLQAFLPYPPHGFGNFIRILTNIFWKIFYKLN